MQSWFRISDGEAIDKATGFLVLAHGWGSPPVGAELDRKIKRDLSKVFEWVSDNERRSFEAAEARRITEQKVFISPKPSSPRFRV